MYEPVQEFEAFQNYTNSKYSSAGTISQKLEEMEKKDKAISNTISMFFSGTSTMKYSGLMRFQVKISRIRFNLDFGRFRAQELNQHFMRSRLSSPCYLGLFSQDKAMFGWFAKSMEFPPLAYLTSTPMHFTTGQLLDFAK